MNELKEIELLKAEIKKHILEVNHHNFERKLLMQRKRELSKRIKELEKKYADNTDSKQSDDGNSR